MVKKEIHLVKYLPFGVKYFTTSQQHGKFPHRNDKSQFQGNDTPLQDTK